MALCLGDSKHKNLRSSLRDTLLSSALTFPRAYLLYNGELHGGGAVLYAESAGFIIHHILDDVLLRRYLALFCVVGVSSCFLILSYLSVMWKKMLMLCFCFPQDGISCWESAFLPLLSSVLSLTVIKCHFNIPGIFTSGAVNCTSLDSVYLPLFAFLLYLSSL